MIARIWHGTTNTEKADKYLDYLYKTGVPDYRKTAGNLGAYVLRRFENGVAHFFTLTFWDSFDSIKQFAGSNYERAKYYPEDVNFLLDIEAKAQHFELFGSSPTPDYVRNYAEYRQRLPRWW
jgi:heme-degrading monooxygenase HmoA